MNESELIQTQSEGASESDGVVDLSDGEDEVRGLIQLQKAINHSYVNLKRTNPLGEPNQDKD